MKLLLAVQAQTVDEPVDSFVVCAAGVAPRVLHVGASPERGREFVDWMKIVLQ